MGPRVRMSDHQDRPQQQTRVSLRGIPLRGSVPQGGRVRGGPCALWRCGPRRTPGHQCRRASGQCLSTYNYFYKLKFKFYRQVLSTQVGKNLHRINVKISICFSSFGVYF